MEKRRNLQVQMDNGKEGTHVQPRWRTTYKRGGIHTKGQSEKRWNTFLSVKVDSEPRGKPAESQEHFPTRSRPHPDRFQGHTPTVLISFPPSSKAYFRQVSSDNDNTRSCSDHFKGTPSYPTNTRLDRVPAVTRAILRYLLRGQPPTKRGETHMT